MGSLLRMILGVLVLLVILGVALIYSGIYNVAAIYPDSAPVAWVLDNTMEHSVDHHAAGIKVPALNDLGMIKTGFSHYQGMCVECHGAPGIPIGDLGKGLNPSSPELKDTVSDWKPNELFWLTKNGVRMTGMPAWGVTHSEDDIWAIVAFMQRLPLLTPDEYKKLMKEVPPMMK